MPTLQELQQKYPGKSPEQLQAAWAAKYPDQPLTGAEAAAPGLWDRVKSVATNPTVLKTLGTTAGLALAPETGGLSVPLMAAGGSMLGGLASKVARGEKESLGDAAWDAAEGAVTPYVGPALKGVGKALGYVGESIPRSVRGMLGFGGLMTGHPAAMGLEVATNPKLMPKLLTKAGEGAEALVSKVKGSARPMLGLDAEAAPVAEQYAGSRSASRFATRPSEGGYVANKGAVSPANPQQSVGDMVGGGNIMDRMFAENNPVFREVEKRGAFAGPRNVTGLDEATGSIAGRMAEHNPSLDALEDIIGRTGGAGVKSVQGFGDMPAEAAASLRPVSSHMHPADTSGAKFGFDKLPKISEGELTRIQALFKRTTGR